jgi:hypothetical protein
VHIAHGAYHSLYAQAGHIGYLLAGELQFAAIGADIVLVYPKIGYESLDTFFGLIVQQLCKHEELKPQALSQQSGKSKVDRRMLNEQLMEGSLV